MAVASMTRVSSMLGNADVNAIVCGPPPSRWNRIVSRPAVLLAARIASLNEIAPAQEPLAENTVSKVGGDSGITLSGNVALVTEYRFRGVDLSGGEIAIQGGVDLAHDSGFYAGTWASSLDEDTIGYGSTEVDVCGLWR